MMWCERGDSNPHGLPRQILSLVRLPISPLSHFAGHEIDDNRRPLGLHEDGLGFVWNPGKYIRAFRHQRYAGAGWETIENSGNRRLRAPKSTGGQIPELVVGNARHVKEELIFLPGERQLLQLPLVDLDIRAPDFIQEAVVAG